MNRRPILLSALCCLAIAGTVIVYDPYKRESCVSKSVTNSEGPPKGYEFIDLGRKQVWATANWTDDEFQAFELPWHKPLYFKNDPRVGYFDRGQILKSPGCPTYGTFNTLNAFGREFAQVVQLVAFDRIGEGEAQLLSTRLIKYHELTYYAGRQVQVLHTPNDMQYIAVARTADRQSDQIELPAGWQIRTYRLNEDLDLELFGEITNIRTMNKDSFQGPLSDEDRFPRAADASS